MEPINPFEIDDIARPITSEVVEHFALCAVEQAFLVGNAVMLCPSHDQSDRAWKRLRKCLLVTGKYYPDSAKLYSAIVQNPARPLVVPKMAKLLNVDEATANRHYESLIGAFILSLTANIKVASEASICRNDAVEDRSIREKGRNWGAVLMEEGK
jgi:hypothetical protein